MTGTLSPNPSDELRRLLIEATGQLREARRKIAALESRAHAPIAITGIGCRFPGGAEDADGYFRVLKREQDAVREVPEWRWPADADADATDPQARAARWGAFLAEVRDFDPAPFGLPPREACALDPQQRLLLETTWEALEQAGLCPGERQRSRTGVFVGMMNADYLHEIQISPGLGALDVYAATGNGHCFPAGRLAYTFGFEGPTLTVDTACSSSLVALHLACQSLRARESERAIVAAASLMLSRDTMHVTAKTSAMSPDGRCRSFDAGANGFVRGEGVATLVLEPLASAQARGQPILAVIRGSAVNHDGRSTGMTAPNVLAQIALLKSALTAAGLDPSAIGYVEAHGTGTPLGDPIEFDALTEVYGQTQARPCVIGAAKSAIGHLEAAAGLAGLVKTILCMQHGEIPANLNFRRLNPRITTEGTRFVFPTKAVAWPRGGDRRVAAVSAFGLSGTNAHVILEEGDVQPPSAAGETGASESASSVHTLTLSAASEGSLRQQSERYAAALESGELSLSGASYTSATLRAAGRERLSVTGSRAEVCEQLRRYGRGESVTRWVRRGRSVGHKLRVGYLFTGQGSQYDGMASALYRDSAVYRAAYERCVASAPAEVASCLRAVASGEKFPQLGSTQYTQPALYAVGYGLSELWSSYGLSPSVVLGHSVGEYVAATVAGLWSVETGMRLVSARGRLMQQLCESGAMVSVRCDPQLLQQVLSEHRQLDVASYNGAGQYVLSGSEVAVSAAREWLAGQGVKSRRLAVSHGFHSREMSSMQQAYQQEFSEVEFERSLSSEVISNVTGAVISAEQLGQAQYWVQHVREPVRFAQGVESLLGQKLDACVELGAQPTLSALAAEHCKSLGRGSELSFVYSLRAQEEPQRTLRDAAGALFVQGAQLNWQNIVAPDPALKVALPTYAFDRKRYWLDGVGLRQDPQRKSATSLVEQLRPAATADNDGQRWSATLHPSDWGVLADHRVAGCAVAPLTFLADMLERTADRMEPSCKHQLEQLTTFAPLVIEDQAAIELEVTLSNLDDAGRRASLRTRLKSAGGAWTEHCTARARALASPFEALPVIEESRCMLDASSAYETLASWNLNYGAGFRLLSEISLGERTASACATIADHAAEASGPQLLDAGLQLVALLLQRHSTDTILPVGVDRFSGAWAQHAQVLRLEASLRSASAQEPIADVVFRSLDGQLLGGMSAVRGRRFSSAALRQLMDPHAITRAPTIGLSLKWCASPLRASNARLQDVLVVGSGPWAQNVAAMLELDGCRVARASDTTQCMSLALTANTRVVCCSLVASEVRDAVDRRAIAVAADVQSLVHWVTAKRHSLIVLAPDHARTSATSAALAGDVVAGLLRVASSEDPGLRACLARVSADLEHEPQQDLLTQVCAEVSGPLDDIEVRIAVDTERCTARLLPMQSSSTAEGSARLRGGYIVTGGLGGLGLETATWLVARGVMTLWLLGRSAPNAQARSVIAALERSGATIHVLHCDVGDEAELLRVLETLDETTVAVRGIVHCAGVLDDGPLREQTAARLAAVMRPKVVGAWTLHGWSRTRELDHFVMFSSIASLLGSEHQSSYAAANAFLDGLALERQAEGLPAVSINWGPWANVGMAASLGDYLLRQGLRLLAPQDALERMGHAMASGRPQVAIIDADWPRIAAAGVSHRKTLLETLVAENGVSVEPQLLRDAIASLSPEDGARSCLAYVLTKIKSTLGLEASAALDADCGFRDLGLDSLMLVELRDSLLSATGLSLPATLLLDVGTPLGLARHLADRLCSRLDSSERAHASTADIERDALNLLHDQQVQELLDHELAEAMRL